MGLACGFAHSYWDYWRRQATEDILYGEEEKKYFNQLKGMNNVRVGEEDETNNLVQYLTGTTTRL